MQDGKPRKVPPVTPEAVAEKHRYEEAQLRRQLRLRHAEDLKKYRAETGRGPR